MGMFQFENDSLRANGLRINKMRTPIFALPNIIIGLFFLTFGVLIWRRNKTSAVTASFAVMCTVIFFWLVSYGVSYFYSHQDKAFFWLKCGYSAVVFIPIAFYLLAITFLE